MIIGDTDKENKKLTLYKLIHTDEFPDYIKNEINQEEKTNDKFLEDFLWSDGGSSFLKKAGKDMIINQKLKKSFMPTNNNFVEFSIKNKDDRNDVFVVLQKWIYGNGKDRITSE